MKIKFAIYASLFLALPLAISAQEGLKIQSVSVFKNQTAFFVKNGLVKTKNKSWEIHHDTIPAALNGTLWLSSPSHDFKMVKAYQKKVKQKQKYAASNFSTILALNDGKTVSLHFADTSYTGTILLMQADTSPISPYTNLPLFALAMTNGHHLIFTQQQLALVQRVEFADNPQYRYNFEVESTVPTLQIDFKSNKKEQELQMMYLSKGLAWKPDYLIELTQEDKAQITLRSTVINNAEDIETDRLNLVAGVPNFKYATSISDLINFVRTMPPIAYNSFNMPSMSNSVRVNTEAFNDNYLPSPTTTTASGTFSSNLSNFNSATSMEDLYFYTLKNIVLKKGERAFFDIFSVEVPVEHIYESILDNNNINYSISYSFLKKKNPVLHTIKLQNNSKYTWTAAAALVMKNDQKQYAPISQDKLKYTSQQNHVSIKLTEAPDVSVKFKEEEINRIPNKKSIKRGNYPYYSDFVTVEAEMEIHNFKNKDIRLDLKRMITGELLESDSNWKKVVRVQYGYHNNLQTDVCWELKLKAGEKKIIKYTYNYYTTEHR